MLNTIGKSFWTNLVDLTRKDPETMAAGFSIASFLCGIMAGVAYGEYRKLNEYRRSFREINNKLNVADAYLSGVIDGQEMQ